MFARGRRTGRNFRVHRVCINFDTAERRPARKEFRERNAAEHTERAVGPVALDELFLGDTIRRTGIRAAHAWQQLRVP